MKSIHIVGGNPLSGEIRIHGAKNAALPILTAASAVSGVFALRNCPHIRDIEVTRLILNELGVQTVWSGDNLLVDSRGRFSATIRPELSATYRASSLFLGALTGAWGSAEVPFPGGCPIALGHRPLDLHIEALRALGVDCTTSDRAIICRGRPCGGSVSLRFPSVGATENMILAALGASGPVCIHNAAREPEIEDLAVFLTACGADIRGAGTSRIEIRPAPLEGANHSILPDRMEAVTYLCAAACAGGCLTLTNTRPETIRPVLDVLRTAGCEIRESADRILFRSGALRAAGPITTGPYPAFPTDAQAPVMAVMALAAGTTCITEAVFPSRFMHTDGLKAMGADITLCDHTAIVRGVSRLHGAAVRVPDLRGGAALLCAALGAEGESFLTNAHLLERGYQDLVPNLRSLGAELESSDACD